MANYIEKVVEFDFEKMFKFGPILKTFNFDDAKYHHISLLLDGVDDVIPIIPIVIGYVKLTVYDEMILQANVYYDNDFIAGESFGIRPSFLKYGDGTIYIRDFKVVSPDSTPVVIEGYENHIWES